MKRYFEHALGEVKPEESENSNKKSKKKSASKHNEELDTSELNLTEEEHPQPTGKIQLSSFFTYKAQFSFF